MTKKKQTPLTVELFFEEVMPAIEEMVDTKIQGVKDDVKGVKDDVSDYKVETIGEIQALRQQVTTTLHQYERNDKRLTRVEKKLHLSPIDL